MIAFVLVFAALVFVVCVALLFVSVTFVLVVFLCVFLVNKAMLFLEPLEVTWFGARFS